MTSHAAVVARGMGKPCVSGAGALRVELRRRHHEHCRAHVQGGRYHHHRANSRQQAAVEQEKADRA
jgi:phosphoenolpyruvate synthase/pyruvate phosphate dikinase